MAKWQYSSTHEVSSYLHVPAALTPNRSPNTDVTRQLSPKADL